MSQPFCEQIDVFAVENKDVHRIPALVVSTQGTILAFSNRRIGSAADHGHDIHLVLRRSFDDGKSWQPTQVLFARDGWSAAIGNAAVDQRSGAIMIIYGRSVTVDGISEKELVEGSRRPPDHPDAGHFILRSTDDGATWTEERLSLRPNRQGLSGSTHGGGPAMQLSYGPHAGRLVMPARTWAQPVFDLTRHTYNCVIFSDDGGATWQTSEVVQAGTGEAAIVETIGGAILLNSRCYHRREQRMTAWSYDSGESFSNFGWARDLTDTLPQGCNGSMFRCTDAISSDRSRILFANPASPRRERMTVRVSYDEGERWAVSRLLNAGAAAYSTLAVTKAGTILCFYERGENNPYEKMTVARFNLAWLESPSD